MIPVNMQKDILSRIHCGHMGVVKCLQRAKDAVYWPGISKDISDMILKCETCINMRNSNAKEPMTPGPTPNRPWDVLAIDLFHWNNQYCTDSGLLFSLCGIQQIGGPEQQVGDKPH